MAFADPTRGPRSFESWRSKWRSSRTIKVYADAMSPRSKGWSMETGNWTRLGACVLVITLAACKTTSPQLVRDDYEEVDDVSPVRVDDWSKHVAVGSAAGSRVEVGRNAIVNDAALAEARPFSLVMRDGRLSVMPRQDLCLEVTRETHGLYRGFDHVGGWKDDVGRLAILSAVVAAGYAGYAASKATDAPPAYALNGSPFAPPDISSRETWNNRALGAGIASGGLALTSILAFSSNWWTTPERQSERSDYAAKVAPSCRDSARRILFRPQSVRLAAEDSNDAAVWQRTDDAEDGLVLMDGTPPNDLSGWLKSVLDQSAKHELAFSVVSDVLGGKARVPVALKLLRDVRQPVAQDGPEVTALVQSFVRGLPTRPLAGAQVVFAQSGSGDGISAQVPCGVELRGLDGPQRQRILAMAPAAFVERGEILLATSVGEPAAFFSTAAEWGKPSLTSVDGKCTIAWKPVGCEPIDAWLRATSFDEKLPQPDLGLTHSVWAAGQATAVRGKLLAAAEPFVDARLAAFEAGKLGDAALARYDAAAIRQEIVGPFVAAAVTIHCRPENSASPVCAEHKALERKVATQVATKVRLRLATAVLASVTAMECSCGGRRSYPGRENRKESAYSADDKPDALVAKCVAGEFARLEAIVAPGGIFPDTAMANQLRQAKTRAVGVATRGVAVAKQAEAADRRRREAEERQQEAEERRSNRGGGGGGGGGGGRCLGVFSTCARMCSSANCSMAESCINNCMGQQGFSLSGCRGAGDMPIHCQR